MIWKKAICLICAIMMMSVQAMNSPSNERVKKAKSTHDDGAGLPFYDRSPSNSSDESLNSLFGFDVCDGTQKQAIPNPQSSAYLSGDKCSIGFFAGAVITIRTKGNTWTTLNNVANK